MIEGLLGMFVLCGILAIRAALRGPQPPPPDPDAEVLKPIEWWGRKL